MCYFSIQLGISWSQLTNMFQRGRYTTNQLLITSHGFPWIPMLVEKVESILGKLFSRCVGVSVTIRGSKTSSNNWNMGMGQNLTIQQKQQNLCIFRIYSIYIYIYTQYIHIILYILNRVSSTQNACASFPLHSGYGLNRPIGSWKDWGRHLRHWRISFCFESQNGGMDGLDFQDCCDVGFQNYRNQMGLGIWVGFPGLLWCWIKQQKR